MIKNRHAIMNLVMRSTPLHNPIMQTSVPISTASPIQAVMLYGFSSVAAKNVLICAGVSPAKSPRRAYQQYDNIQPVMVV